MSLQEIYQDARAAKRRGMGIARRLTAKDAPLLAMRVWMDFGICTEGVKCVYLSYIGLYYFNTPPIVVETDRKQIKRSRRGGRSCLRKVAARHELLTLTLGSDKEGKAMFTLIAAISTQRKATK